MVVGGCYCVTPPHLPPSLAHTLVDTQAHTKKKITNCLPACLPAALLWPCLSAALLAGSWLDGDVERKVCLCILPAFGQGANTHTQKHSLRYTHWKCRHTYYVKADQGGHTVCVYTNTSTHTHITPHLHSIVWSPCPLLYGRHSSQPRAVC